MAVSESAESAPGPAEPSKPSEGGALRRLALRGSLFELAGYAATYILRFASSTVLRSLLFPAAFGVMEVVNGINIGLVMLSDVGIQQAIVQSKRGDEPVFLDTAWTMHVVRGLGLWLVACLAAYPASLLAGDPDLATYIPIASLGIVLLGFGSTSEFSLRRRMTLGRVIMMDVICQVTTMSVTITWAYLHPSVWALVAGGIANAAVRVSLTHWLAGHVGHRNRFAWDPEVRKEIFEFGKWITGSSAVFFASSWGDRLLLVAFLGTATSGVYATAVLIAESIGAALDRVVHGVFYPLFSRVGREGTDRLRHVYYATRLRFDAMTMTATGTLVVLGPWIIRLLFDERYADAGWMLRVLALRSAMTSVVAPCETCLTSLGHTRFGFYQNVARAIWVLAGVPIAFWVAGVEGVVWVTALSMVPSALVLWPKFRSIGILRIDRELLAWGFFAGGLALGLAISMVLPDAVWLRGLLRDLVRGGQG